MTAPPPSDSHANDTNCTVDVEIGTRAESAPSVSPGGLSLQSAVRPYNAHSMLTSADTTSFIHGIPGQRRSTLHQMSTRAMHQNAMPQSRAYLRG